MQPDWVRRHYQQILDNQRKLGRLAHHGIKGQKWGVRRTPEELGHERPGRREPKKEVEKSKENSTIVQEAIRSGQVSKKINREKQMRHTLSGHLPGRSYLHGGVDFAQRLVDELSGTGEAKKDSRGNWTRKEMVRSPQIIGTYVDLNGVEVETAAAVIVYSNTGSHIYPRKEDEK